MNLSSISAPMYLGNVEHVRLAGLSNSVQISTERAPKL